MIEKSRQAGASSSAICRYPAAEVEPMRETCLAEPDVAANGGCENGAYQLIKFAVCAVPGGPLDAIQIPMEILKSERHSAKCS